MANTYVLIASNTLGSAAASVTFSSIPGTYTDLVLKTSIRTEFGGTYDEMMTRLNSDATSLYSGTYLEGQGSNGSSSGQTGSVTRWRNAYIGGGNATANTFGNGELYIPNYTSTTSKPAFYFGVSETDSTVARMNVLAYLYRNSSALTSMVLSPQNTTNFVSGSSFWLYGIKKD